jgi:hypothetical protein
MEPDPQTLVDTGLTTPSNVTHSALFRGFAVGGGGGGGGGFVPAGGSAHGAELNNTTISNDSTALEIDLRIWCFSPSFGQFIFLAPVRHFGGCCRLAPAFELTD